MSKAGPPYTFDVNEMLVLRSQGMSYTALGRKYGKDHTTIMYHCRRFGITPPRKPLAYKREKVYIDPAYIPPPPHKYDSIWNEKINPGHSYKYLLKKARERDAWYQTHARTTLATHPPRYKAED